MSQVNKEKLSGEPDAMEEYNAAIVEHLKSQDELEFELGDTFDIKTSILLIVIIFLAQQSEKFLAAPMPLHWHWTQVVSVVCIIVSGSLAVWELVPRKYRARMRSNEFLEWVEKLRDFYSNEGVSNPERKIVEQLRRVEIEKMKERFRRNSAINKSKAKVVKWSFRFMIAALAMNLMTLCALSSGWRF